MKALHDLIVDISKYPLNKLELHQYLIYFDGALLSHYIKVDDFGYKEEDWLYLWVDTNDNLDRWLLFEANRDDIKKYIAGHITLLDLLNNPKNEIIYVCDLEKRRDELKRLSLITFSYLPEDYLPTSDSYYEFEPMPAGSYEFTEFENFHGLINLDGQWSLKNLSYFSDIFNKIYAFSYKLTDKNISSTINSYPWRGGYSSIGFINRIMTEVDTPPIEYIKYASPGMLYLDVNEDASEILEQSFFGYLINKRDINSIYKNIESYIRKNKLNDDKFLSKELDISVEQQQVLFDFLKNIIKNINLSWLEIEFDSFIFFKVKAFMLYIRMLRELEKFHVQGLAQIDSVNRLLEKIDNNKTKMNTEYTWEDDDNIPF